MRILLFGKNGQVGWELQRTLASLGEVIALGQAEADFSRPESLRQIVRQVRPQVIVNAAAYTDVDGAESEADLAMTVNATAPSVLAEEARRIHAVLIHYSTDYVFDGTKGSPYVESDVPNPLSTYGRSKLEGEIAIQAAGGAYLILRTAWVYSLRGENFVTKVLKWAREKETLRIVNDQISNPTWARMLAEVTAQLLVKSQRDIYNWGRSHSGIYHLAGSGYASRLEWARLILELDPNRHEQMVKEMLPAPTSDFPTPARRPLFSALNCERFIAAFGLYLPPWEKALQIAMGRSVP